MIPQWLRDIDETSFGNETLVIPRDQIREFVELIKALHPNNKERVLFMWPSEKELKKNPNLKPVEFHQAISINWDQTWNELEKHIVIGYEAENKIQEIIEKQLRR